ncbi:hybrid sensor histidine kinase/response regulator [Solimonas sp. K1W22B-7]|uniref:Hpt domain-containing protein n=1 Tax=Solimonas sp. K1W22B-7 TaxID=2303331 RepID=UPI000E337844|nr:Hpt domain-containing protein [Solimonas sp. K1W22B-7]AXQ29833.1 hybrid sensor histidine kinase/response regulator [Solimonas sp. K1W22B-7]
MNARLRANTANGLHWVRGEIEQSLSRVRTLVEQHAEGGTDPLPMQQAFVELHQVRGTASMIQCYGIAELAEEMKQAIGDLLHGRIRETDAAYSALLGATVLLSDYIESLADGMDDCVLILQPAINELRLARGKAVLTEADLFVMQMQGLALGLPLPEDDGRTPGAAQQQSHKYLSVYQASLLHWLKGDADAATALARIGKIAELLAGCAELPAIHQLWRVVAAVVEALLGHSLDESLEVKRLIGRSGAQIKLMAAEGEPRAELAVGDLSLQLLYFIGRSRGQGPRVTVMRKAFQLQQLLPGATQLEELRRRIHGPNTTLLMRVSDEIRADFAKIKDVIDLAVRAGGKSLPDIEGTRRSLKRISDTLSILGLGTLQRIVDNQSHLLDGLGDAATPTAWMELATSILRVEHSLDDALFQQLRQARTGEPAADNIQDIVPHSRDLAEGIDALQRESLVNLAKLKSQVDAVIRGQEGSIVVVDAARMLEEIASGFRILQDERAAGLVEHLVTVVRSPAFASLRDSQDRADRFADAVACVEYYIEAVRDNLPDAGYILDNLARFVGQLDFGPGLALVEAASEPSEPAPLEMQSLADLVLAEPPAAADSPVLELAPEPVPVSTPTPVVVSADDVDPEIREIFLEEAAEVLQTLQSAMPRWTRDASDRDSLTTLRRAFHTLKGSGRMVGAAAIGDFGWAFEQLLNKCLDGSVSVSAPVVTVAIEAVELLPRLIDSFRERLGPPAPLAGLVERAQNLAAGRGAQEQPEPDLVQIFREDARGKLAEIRDWLGGLDRSDVDFDVNDDVVRAYHTLRGAGHIVSATALAELAEALEAHLDSVRGATLRLGGADVDLLEEATAVLAQWVEEVGTPAVEKQDARAWLERIEHLSSAVPEDAVQAAEDRQLAEIFSGEALELVQKFEDTARAWSQAPDNRQAPLDLKVVLHTLKGAAYMSNCEPIGDVAKILHARMDQAIGGEIQPDAAGFAALVELTEGMYQLLDAYRDGRLRDEGAAWVRRAADFAWRGDAIAAAAAPVALVAEVPLEMPPITVEPVAEAAEEIELVAAAEPPPAEALPLSAEVEAALEVIEMPAVESEPEAEEEILLELAEPAIDLAEPALEQVEPVIELAEPVEEIEWAELDAAAVDAGSLPEIIELAVEPAGLAEALPESLPEPGLSLEILDEPVVEVTASDGDAVLDAGLLLDLPAEAEARIEPVAAEHSEPALEMPAVVVDEELDTELMGVFLAEAEELLESLDRSNSTLERNIHDLPATAELKRVLHTLKGSARMAGLDDIGEVAHHLETLFERIERGQARADAGFFAQMHSASDGLHMVLDDLRRGKIPNTQALLADLTEERAAAEPTPAPVADYAPSAESLRSYDAELGEIFSGEAAELLEALEQSLRVWVGEPTNPAPIRDLQRVLHTFKGGARMAGLNAMGDLAHDMETRINRIEAGLEAADAATLAELSKEGERLHHMHDLLERGDISALTEGEGEAAAVAEERLTLPEEAPVALPVHAWDPLLFWRPEEESEASFRRETARVPVEALDGMLNEAGEISIYRSRLEEHNSGVEAQLDEMRQAIARIRDQLRQMDTETDAQIAARGLGHTPDQSDRYAAEFDPLEMDRYTRMQELSRALNESIGDLAGLHATMDGLISEADTLLMQQGRVNTSLQQGLMRTLMVPFSRQVSRLQRVVKQTASENGKQAEAVFAGVESELDRNVLERMTAPLEHLLRNAVVHGIEDPATRAGAGKEGQGRIAVSLWRDGSQLLIELRDDGKGLDFEAIRAQAIRKGLMPPDAQASDDEVAQFIFQPGFSTAKKLTQDAGRGIGMDVVASEVKQLGGTLELSSEWGKGTRFLVRLPLTLAMSQALLVGVGHEQYAVLLSSVEGIARIPREQLDDYYNEDGPLLSYGSAEYRVRYLGDFIDVPRDKASESRTVNAILVRMGEGLGAAERRIAVVVDQLLGNREIVSKAVGPQVSSVGGVTGATILADGRVVLILDPGALAQDRARRTLASLAAGRADAADKAEDVRNLIMVVDDSITIRRVTERLLLKNGYRVVTAKDGLDAMAQLQTETPAAILLDIEMPRADGFEVATFVRNSTRISATPIIMITSRSGDKHRERARSIGVNRYLIKPYQEEQLVGELREVIEETT